MPTRDQGVMLDRYMLIPRTATFVRKGDSYLLIRGSPSKRLWPGTYNGVGGHVGRGEDILTAALRELREETGLEGRLWLCGIIAVDAGAVGIGLHVFTGQATGGSLQTSAEGQAEWIPFDRIPSLPTVEDVPQIVERIHRMRRGDPCFSARSFYDEGGRLHLVFAN